MMDSKRVWEIIENARWSEDYNYTRIRNELLGTLTPEEANSLRTAFYSLKRALHCAIKEVEGLELYGDSCDDLIAHIIGLGEKEFNLCINEPEHARKHENSYVESFAYALPYKEDFEVLKPEHFQERASKYLAELKIDAKNAKFSTAQDIQAFDVAVERFAQALEEVSSGKFELMEVKNYEPKRSGYSSVSESPLYKIWKEGWDLDNDIFHYGTPNMILEYNNVKEILKK